MKSLFSKLGGRKFALTLIVLIIGAVVEIAVPTGLSANFVTLLLGSSTIFGMANAAVTMKHGGQPAAVTESAASQPPAYASLSPDDIQAISSRFTQTSIEIESLATEQARQRDELVTQSEALATATKLIKTLAKL